MKGRLLNFALLIVPWLFVSLMLPGLPYAQGGSYKIAFDVFSQAGGSTGNSAQYKIQDSVGQPSPMAKSDLDSRILYSGFMVLPLSVIDYPQPLNPKRGNGTGVLDLDKSAEDQSARWLRGMKSGDMVDVQVLFTDKEVPGATGFDVTLRFNPKKLSLVSGKGDGVFVTAISPGPPLVKGNTVTYGAALLGQTTTAKDGLAVLTFKAIADILEDTEILLTNLSIRISNGRKDVKPGASVILSGKLPSDFNGDGIVDFDDFFLFASAFRQSETGDYVKFDLDGDRRLVDFNDFFLFAADFGKGKKTK